MVKPKQTPPKQAAQSIDQSTSYQGESTPRRRHHNYFYERCDENIT